VHSARARMSGTCVDTKGEFRLQTFPQDMNAWYLSKDRPLKSDRRQFSVPERRSREEAAKYRLQPKGITREPLTKLSLPQTNLFIRPLGDNTCDTIPTNHISLTCTFDKSAFTED
jgi:hypothetical protein